MCIRDSHRATGNDGIIAGTRPTHQAGSAIPSDSGKIVRAAIPSVVLRLSGDRVESQNERGRRKGKATAQIRFHNRGKTKSYNNNQASLGS